LARRKAKLENTQNMIVEMRPEFAQALRRSISFSCKFLTILIHDLESHGKSASLLKMNSKKKRTFAEMEEVKEEEKSLK
jgi:hypothetical protein